MEIVLAAFIGVWFSFFAVWSLIRLKKEYKNIIEKDIKGERK